MTIRSASLLALTSLLTAACFASGDSPTKRLDRSAFQGFTIVEQGQQLRTQLSGYEFQLKGGQSIEPENCTVWLDPARRRRTVREALSRQCYTYIERS